MVYFVTKDELGIAEIESLSTSITTPRIKSSLTRCAHAKKQLPNHQHQIEKRGSYTDTDIIVVVEPSLWHLVFQPLFTAYADTLYL